MDLHDIHPQAMMYAQTSFYNCKVHQQHCLHAFFILHLKPPRMDFIICGGRATGDDDESDNSKKVMCLAHVGCR